MTQRNISSYKPVIYVLAILFCIFIIHVAEKIQQQHHEEEIRKYDEASNKKLRQKVKKAKSLQEAAKMEKPDTLVRVSEASVDTVAAIKLTPEKSTEESDAAYFQQLIQQYEKQRTGDTQARTDVVIRYYKKNKDGDRVYKLRNLGFYIHERHVEADYDGYASNAIFYGDSVSREDLMVIAYDLIASGIKLQSITLSKYHDAWKAHSVEIGTDVTALDEQPFTASTLREKWQDL
ncbi:hypothetical protein N7E81_03780 [Reichenbachiella carrageenanivorans]|uniref:Uncharacterized protein n=1 Tax=Reichenbachiella carrageenanivorans TaxID=2979869 RepID=A0ABY6D585_9BACT|nr:hypothetical protein [Reichenbachiella carrageenanivorans]UXX80218.1 hypothetical protein N7E81_03780 [Reichenbachiella carrageenanivorans]